MIQHAARELEKLAFNWTPAKARAVEALAGGGAGGLLGGMAGSGTYTPRAPVHRIDSNGFLMQRELSKEEKAESMKRTLKAAGLGAAAGVGASLGASKALRHLMDSAEKDLLDATLKGTIPGRKGLPQRKEELDRLVRRRFQDQGEAFEGAHRYPRIPGEDDDLAEITHMGDLADSPGHPKQRLIEEAGRMLAGEEKRIIGLSEQAKHYRDARPFGHLRKVIDPTMPTGQRGEGIPDPRGRLLGLLDIEEKSPGGLVGFYNKMVRERAGSHA